MLDRHLTSIVNELDFETAFRRVKYDSQYDFIQMPVEFIIYDRFYEKNIEFLKESILQQTYRPRSLRKIWVPKRGFLLRPGSIPHLDDRILFQAITDLIAPLIESFLPPMDQEVVFSARLNPEPKSEKMFVHPRSLWLSFKKKAQDYASFPGIRHVLVSDIASYFDNIDLRLLTDTMTSCGISSVHAEAVKGILTVWANGRTRGIPQMLAPCSLLSNLYLSQVDKLMILKGYKYIRYVDDIRIYTESEIGLKKALLDLTEQLKNCYLHVQASKTKFQAIEEHLHELTKLETHLMETGIEIKSVDSSSYFTETESRQVERGTLDIKEFLGEKRDHTSAEVTIDQSRHREAQQYEISEIELIKFLEELLVNPEYDDRHLRFCINNLGRIGSPAAIDLVLSKIVSMPQETATFVQYLLRLDREHIRGEHVQKIIDFIVSDESIYEWQIMWLLIFLSRHGRISETQLRALMSAEKLDSGLPVNRALVLYIRCLNGGLSVQRECMARYNQENQEEVRLAILCGLKDLEKKERNRFYSLATVDRQTSQLIELLKIGAVPFC